MASASFAPNASSFTMLLNLYMQGAIPERAWHSLMRLMDADGVSSTERLALARFVRDVVSESGSRALRMPMLDEVQDLLSWTRNP